MTNKLLATASALVLGLSISTAAMAQSTTDDTVNAALFGSIAASNTEDNDNNDSSTNIADSGNTSIDDSGNTTVDVNDSGNDNSNNQAWLASNNTDNSGNNRGNSDSSTTNVDIEASLSVQTLAANVSDIGVDIGNGLLTVDNAGDLATGNLNYGSSFTDFAGVSTHASNTGVASVNQAGTSLSATSSISFD